MASADGIFAIRTAGKTGGFSGGLRFSVSARLWNPWDGVSFPEESARSLACSSGWPAPWQVPEWQAMLREAGACSATWAVFELAGGKVAALAMAEERSLGLGFSGLFCAGGPAGSPSRPDAFSAALRALALRERAVFFQAEPYAESPALAGWKAAHYKRLFERHTAWLDLSRGEDEILSSMKEKGRYNVRLSAKHGVSARAVPATDANLDAFLALLSETLERDGFSGNSRAHYRAMLDLLERENWGGLYLAEKDGKVLAAGVFTFLGKLGTYYYGASTSDNALRKFMPAYALQWAAIRDAKARGCSAFDFLGIDDPSSAPGHLAGVTDFKMKFNPSVKTWPAARSFVARPWALRLLKLARAAKRLIGR